MNLAEKIRSSISSAPTRRQTHEFQELSEADSQTPFEVKVDAVLGFDPDRTRAIQVPTQLGRNTRGPRDRVVLVYYKAGRGAPLNSSS